MRTFLSIIKKEWLAMSRDVHGLLVLFAMPAVFILIMSLALRDTFKPAAFEKIHWGICDIDNTTESTAFLKNFRELRHQAEITYWKAPANLENAVAKGEPQIGILIKPGFGTLVGEMDADAKVKTASAPLVILAEPGLPPALAAAFRADVTRALTIQRTRELMGASWPQDENGNDLSADNLAGLSLIESRHTATADTNAPLTAVQQSVPAWLVFAMFFVVIPLSTIFIAERQQGTLPRLRSLRVPTWLILAGKVFPFYIVNLIQTVLMLLVGRYIVPLCGGDALALNVNWLALGCIASAVSLAAIGFALAIATLVRTTEQATTIGGIANILLAALGGVMVPKLVMPAAMQKITAFSPMSWGLEGFLNVFVRHAGPLGVLTPVAMLLAFALICLAIARWQLGHPRTATS